MVHFDDSSTQFIETHEQLSTHVPADMLWYTHGDYDQFREDATSEAAEASPEDRHTSSRSRHEFIQDLLQQQSEQRLLGISDPKGLLVMSRACSQDAKLRARQIALQVARDVGSLSPERTRTKKTAGSRSPLWSRRGAGLAKKTVCATTA